jgi:YesN/AraC family two-component response regulator
VRVPQTPVPGPLTSPLDTPLKMLWIDLRINRESPVAKEQLQGSFALTDCGYTQSIGPELRSIAPDALLADFDYPDRAGLRLVQELKAKFPAMPILMATIQHSEELAVWAFRSGVLDYFVKPIDAADLLRCRNRLQRIRQEKRKQRDRRVTLGSAELPLEAAPAQSSDMRSLAPAVHYVSQNFREKIRRDEVAALCAMNPFRFSRLFREVYGLPFRDFVVRYRIREACRLLDNPTASVTSVAFAVGFNEVGYFSRMFKHYTGHAPSAFKEELKKAGKLATHLQLPDDLVTDLPDSTDSRLRALPPLPGN